MPNKKKVVKLSAKELAERVKKIIQEQEEKQQEEGGRKMAFGVDKDGRHYIVDLEHPDGPKIVLMEK